MATSPAWSKPTTWGQTTTITWTYDALNRLVEETYDSSADDSLDFVERFTFDLAGNRVQAMKDLGNADPLTFNADETTTYEYDDNDRLLTEQKDVAGTATGDRFTTYEYGPNADPVNGYGGDHTTQTAKTVHDGLDDTGAVLETHTFAYDAMGRMTQTTEVKGGTTTVTDYVYDDSGFRVKQTVTVDPGSGGTPVVTEFLVDKQNHTGYAQVLEERVDGVLHKTYTLGHDVLTQADTIAVNDVAAAIHHLLYDGHGSTRAVLDEFANIVQRYAYTAYGVMLDSAALTSAADAVTRILYSGEWTNTNGQQYLRARWYDPYSGRFNRLDPFVGNSQDPQSLHKYLYTHGNPVMRVDPSGLISLPELLVTTGVVSVLNGLLFAALGRNPVQGVVASVQAVSGFTFGPNKTASFIGGILGVAAEYVAQFVERGPIEFANYPLADQIPDSIVAFSEGVFDTAFDFRAQLSPIGPLAVLVVQTQISSYRELFNGFISDPAKAIEDQNYLRIWIKAMISPIFTALTSSVVSPLPKAISKRVQRILGSSPADLTPNQAALNNAAVELIGDKIAELLIPIMQGALKPLLINLSTAAFALGSDEDGPR